MRADSVGYSGLDFVVPSDSADLPRSPCRALHIGGTGTVVVDPADGKTTAVAIPVVAGETLRLQVKRVRKTGTTATRIMAAYGPITKRPPFAPTDFQTLLLWNRSDKVTLAGNLVGTWPDLSGKGQDATASGAQRPTWIADAGNGQPGLVFDGSANLMTSASILTLGGISQLTVWFAGFGSVGATAEIIEYGPSVATIAGTWNLVVDANSASDVQATTHGGATIATEFFSPGTFAAPSFLVVTYDISTAGTQAVIRYNGAAVSTTHGGTASTGAFIDNLVNYANRSGGSFLWKGTMQEVGICTGLLSSSQISQLETYLKSRYRSF
ncbi:MAG TPA: hypothetical protein VFU97_24525 [Xanthobacteraceae bacterium]|nr:hypothetical protein [Xanthobacteraceae bacterium]